MTPQEFHDEYARLAHAVQTGVAYALVDDPKGGSPKHLRVGVNTVKADLGALARLLVAKGLLTEEELFEATLNGLREEIKMYERELSTRMGAEVKLL